MKWQVHFQMENKKNISSLLDYIENVQDFRIFILFPINIFVFSQTFHFSEPQFFVPKIKTISRTLNSFSVPKLYYENFKKLKLSLIG